ncbi:ANX13-like protein [Mya arenaria]|uniref:Annexin n=1 Tax=Mya arenaria TaxID=6604 RepID=A0ABY7FI97_MYAAR|nr:ANX13-like protein [Mya arenaria]
MPRHGPGLGANNFPAANKLLMRYEADRSYKIHQQKLANVKHRLDVKEPKKRNHLILRLKQIQKEEERQAEIDHENKLLLNKMTHVLKNGGNIDNWNNYESRSLNFPFRERHNEDIARENIGIAQRLETVKPKVEISKWRSVDTLNETYEEDNNSVDTSDDKKLPKLKKARKAAIRPTKSETSYPTSKPERSPVRGGGTKLPKINNRAEKSAKIEKVPSIRKEKSAKAVKSAQKENIPYTKKDNGVTAAHKDIGDDKSDVAQLFKIAKQMGRPEDIFIKTLVKKSHKQRMTTKAKFREKYDLDLITELKNGLGQPWEYLIDALLQEKGVADSYAVFDALSTTDMADVVELLCSRDNASINALKESYRKEFSISLEEDISDRSEPPTRTLLLTLQKGARDQSASVDMDEVRKDAQELHEYGDERFESENGIFMKLLLTRNYKHLGAMFREYRNIAGEEILAAMKFDLHCVAAPDVFHADKLQKHSIPSDPVLVNILVARSELDMPEIRKAYKTKFGIDIVEVLKSKPHPTQKCLVELACKGSAPKKTDGKKTYLKETAASKQQEQQQQQQQAKKTGPKKSEPKGKGQGQQQDHSTDNNAPAKSEPTSKSVEAKSQKTKHADHETAPQQKKKDTANEQQAKTQDTQGGDKGKSKGTKDTSDGVRQNNGTVRPYANFNVDADCDKLNSAMTDLQGDEREKVVISIIPRRSNKQRQELKTAYEQKHKKELRAIKEHYQKDDYKGKAKAVEDPVQYYSERIHGCFTSMGVNDNMIVRLVVSRSEIDLEDIKARYMELYSQSLYDAVNSKCQGEYKNLLLAIIDKNVNQSENVESNTTAHRDNKDTDQSVNPPTSSDTDDSKEESNTKGTVSPAETFDPLNDCETLNNAMAGFGTDEAAIIDVLARRANAERQDIKDLERELTSELRGDFEALTVALLTPPVEYDVKCLNGAIKGIGTDEAVLVSIIATRNIQEMEAIKLKYEEMYGRRLEADVCEDVSGGLERMLVQLLACERDQRDTVDMEEVKQDVQRLYKEGQISIDPNDDVFNEIIVKKDRAHVKATFEEYKKVTGADIYHAIKEALTGDAETAYLKLAKAIEDPIQYYTDALHACFKGLGTNDGEVIRIVVSRSEIDLGDISTRYQRTYGSSLAQSVEDECSGDYKRLLLAIVGRWCGQ